MSVSVSRRKLLKDGFWVSGGQVLSVIGSLAGMRLLTEYVSPEIFGAATLYIGVQLLALGTLISPVLQAALKYYPEYAGEKESVLRASILVILVKRTAIFLSILAVVSPLIVIFLEIKASLIFVCSILLVFDGIKSMESTLLNAAGRQKTFAMISLGESWGRPLIAVLAVRYLDMNVQSILTAYAVTSAGILLMYYSYIQRKSDNAIYSFQSADSSLIQTMKRYSLPLAPMSLLGWVNGLGDRYLIGALLGLEQAGIYAAVYGLMSRPFLMASSVVELTLRPLYNQFVAKHMHKDADRLLAKWLCTVSALVVAGFVGIALFDSVIIRMLLAEKYRSGVSLMLWIGGGYVFLALSDVFVKICYAYGYTERILMIQVVGAVFSLVLSTIGIKLYGLKGAAMAVPAYYGVMLIITVIVSKLKIAKSNEDKSSVALDVA